MAYIPYGKQSITAEDVAAVVNVLQSDWLTQGPSVADFERAVASYCGAKYAIAVMNATCALHLACLALGVGTGDIVWTSPNTFVASANCALYCGAMVDFVDICPKTYNLSIEALAVKLKQAAIEKKLPKVVIPVHFAGQSCDMAAIKKLADEYGFKIIEDASHAIGGRYGNEPIGNCLYSDIAIFSFHPVKIITTAEGGMAVTNDRKLADSMRLLRSHGIRRDEGSMTTVSEGGWYYQQMELGFNYRITDLQAALGLSQLTRLDEFVQKRRYLAQRYHELLSDLTLTLPLAHSLNESSWHLYVVQTPHRAHVFEKLRAAGVGVNVHYIPVHTQPYYEKMGFKRNDFPHAVRYYEQAISLPLYFNLTEADQDFIKQQLIDALHL